MDVGTPRAWWSRLAGHPTRGVVLAFALVVALGAALLMLPAAAAPGKDTGVLTALFTTSERSAAGCAALARFPRPAPAERVTGGRAPAAGHSAEGGPRTRSLTSLVVASPLGTELEVRDPSAPFVLDPDPYRCGTGNATGLFAPFRLTARTPKKTLSFDRSTS